MAFDMLACKDEPVDRTVRFMEHDSTFNELCKVYAPDFAKGRLNIDWVEGKVTISRGDVVINTFTNFQWINMKLPRGYVPSKGFIWENQLEKVAGIPYIYLPFQKHQMSFYSKWLGCRPTKFISMFNACMIKAFIPEHLRGVANEFCRFGSSRAYNISWVKSLISNKDIITTLLGDGLTHLIPIVLGITDVDNPTPSTLKQVLGKSVWKSIANNTKSRNLLLSRKSTVEMVKYSSKLPSSLLKSPIRIGYCEFTTSLLRREKLLTKYKRHIDIRNLVYDTKRMIMQCGMNIPKQAMSWDLAKWQEKHDACVEKINALKYSDEKFPVLTSIDKTFVSQCGEFTAEILDNALAIRSEGESMHHCVGNYSAYCLEGEYMVVSISGGVCGRKSSTLGLNWNKGYVEMSQHYVHWNYKVTDQKEIQFAKHIIKCINKQLGEK